MGNADCSLFSEVRILGDAAFTRKPIDHQNGERDTVAVCDVRARGQLTLSIKYVQNAHLQVDSCLKYPSFHRTPKAPNIQSCAGEQN